METKETQTAELIPIDKITVVNPRARNQRSFDEVVESISELGLKRPITVALREKDGEPTYELVCGQGRLEAYKLLEQTEIPAIVILATPEDCLVMSLVENLARRKHVALDLLRDIRGLKERGYSVPQIAGKTQLTTKYVKGVLHLLENGEHRLLRAVESKKIPVSVAVEIAEAQDSEVQQVLRKAYENNVLRGTKLTTAKRLVEARLRSGKGKLKSDNKSRRSLSVESLLKAYQDDVDKKEVLLRKADSARAELTFITEVLRNLLEDDHFVTLLRAEGLATIPQNIANRIQPEEIVGQ